MSTRKPRKNTKKKVQEPACLSLEDNIILIGMPACGKSSVGVILAKALGYDFLDGDLLIQKREGKKLARIMEEKGNEAFLQIEEEVHANLSCAHTVLAPGGSIVYSEKAMEHFQKIGTIIYLKISLDMLTERLQDARNRGVVLRDGESIEELYNERIPLYEKYADITIEEAGCGLGDMVVRIVVALREKQKEETSQNSNE